MLAARDGGGIAQTWLIISRCCAGDSAARAGAPTGRGLDAGPCLLVGDGSVQQRAFGQSR